MKILICLVFVLAAVGSSFGQERSIDKTEFDRLVSNANYPNVSRWKGKNFRWTIITEGRMRGPSKQPDGTLWSMNHTTKSVNEYGPDESYRQSNESTFNDGEVKRSESIRIGDFLYSRTGSENWKKKGTAQPPQPPVTNPPAPPSPFQEISTDKDYKYLGKEAFRNATVKTYLATSRTKSVDKANGTEYESVTTTKYWVDKDGTLLKSEYRAEGKGVDRSSFTGVIMEFLLDPSISITAPDVP